MPVEEVNQFSPGNTADSGGIRFTRATQSGWQITTNKRRISTQNTPRSSRNIPRSDVVRQGHRQSRGRTTPRDRSTRAVTDRVGRGPGIVVLRGN